MNFPFKKKPFKHQAEVFESSRDLEWFAIFWEQGTGKTKLAIDTAAWLFKQGKVTGLLVVAPNTIHANWVNEEIPGHMIDGIRCKSFTYYSAKHASKAHNQGMSKLLHDDGSLAILAITYDALITKHGRKAVRAFLKTYKCLEVLDESARIKNHKAERSKKSIDSGQLAPYRRILTGTPIANSPFDIYNQMRFLSPTFWKDTLGISSFTVFKTEFGVFTQGYNSKVGKNFQQLVGFKNLNLLYETIKPYCSRVTKDEVLDLPPKLYTTLTFELTPRQRKIYDEIKYEFMTFLDSGEMVSADLVITRILRLQQVTSGYVTSDSGKMELIPGDNPRLDLLKEVCEDLPHQSIIWGKFRKDIDLITEALGDRCVRLDGSVKDQDRQDRIKEFQAGNVQFFVGNPAAVGEGITLTKARTVNYYNNSHNLVHRLQSEDRAHRIGQIHSVNYNDLVALRTLDKPILRCLLTKRDFACQITGDEVKKWMEIDS